MDTSSQPITPKENAAPEQQPTPRQEAIVPQVPPPPADAKTASNGGDDRTPPWRKCLETAAVLVAFGLLVVNCFQMRATYKAANAAQEAATAAMRANVMAEQSYRDVRRAYITRVSGGQVSFYGIDANGHPTVGIEIFATGPTPAFSVRRAITWDVRKLPLLKEVPVDDVAYTEEAFTLQNPEADSVRTTIALSPSQRQQIESHAYGVVLWGNVEYLTFRELHHLQFCYLMQNDLKTSTDKCPYHNNSD